MSFGITENVLTIGTAYPQAQFVSLLRTAHRIDQRRWLDYAKATPKSSCTEETQKTDGSLASDHGQPNPPDAPRFQPSAA